MLTTGEWCNPVSNILHHMKKGVEWGSGTRGLRLVAAFWAGIPVSLAQTGEVTQEAGVVSRRRRAAIGTAF